MNRRESDCFYMDIAERAAQNSYCERLKVGACVVTRSGGVYTGFNGTLPGSSNICELENGLTDRRHVIHAEANCFYKMLEEGVSSKGCTIYVTHSPCEICTQMVISSRVERVVYRSVYCEESLLLLKEKGITVEKL